MTIRVQTNLPDFKRELAQLKREMFGISRSATAEGARTVAKAVRRFAPKKTGRLRAAVVVKRARRVPQGETHHIVGIRQGKGAQRVRRRRKGGAADVNLDAYYWRFLEDGFYPRRPGTQLRGGRRTKRLQRQRAAKAGNKFVRIPFIARAFEASETTALNAITSRLDKEFAKRTAKR